jgi:putative transposase
MPPATPLDAFLATVRDAREYKRALVVQLCARGQRAAEVARLLDVSEAFVSTCRKRYATDGVASFTLGYRGGTSFLSADERSEVLTWIADQQRPTVRMLRTYLQETFGVVYESRQSYYALLKEAGLSHKQIQARNPKKTRRRSRPNGKPSARTS